VQTVYKHWLAWMRQLATSPRLPPHTNPGEVANALGVGLIRPAEEGYALTELGRKVIQTADLMDELKRNKLKLSW
jgi:hypothetical protein